MIENSSDFEEKEVETKENQQEESPQSLIPKMQLSEDEVRKIFNAKCDDFGIFATNQLFDRFLQNQVRKSFSKIFEMNSCSLGPKAASAVAKVVFAHPHIKLLSINGNSIGNKGVLQIAELIYRSHTLISVDVSSNSIGDSGAKAVFMAMKSNKTIVSLSIGSSTGVSRNSLGSSSAAELSSLLKENHVLSDLDINMCEITQDTISTIATGLKFNHTLQVLNLGNNNICSKGCRKLLHAIMNSQITTLNISNNHIKDDTAPIFVQYFTKNDKIRSLNIAGNHFTKVFTKAIAQTFADCSQITDLNMSHNPLGSQGIDEFGVAIANNHYLQNLNISMCQIDSINFQSFCNKLEKNSSILNLNLSHNPIGDQGAVMLCNVIKKHPTLVDIDLELCEITDVGGDQLIPCFEVSQTIQRVSVKNNLVRNGKILVDVTQNNPRLIYFNIEYNDIDFKYYNQTNKNIQSNYNHWRGKRKEKLKNQVNKTSDVEFSLYATRDNIVNERNEIVSHHSTIEELKVKCDELKITKEASLKDLGEKLEFVTKEASQQMERIHDIRQEMDFRKEEFEKDIEMLQHKKSVELDNFRRDTSALSGLESRIADTRQKVYSDMQELNNRVIGARQKYQDAVQLMIEAWQAARQAAAKNQPEKPENESQKRKKSSRRKKMSNAETNPDSNRTEGSK
ncbi:Leucine Rich Repeat family protein [Trichomonas vaginalis G3]|uniref:Leucine Rich Repeat family protein n=1 Tax=Trichomonas vaginalis (strain ATCC PRA-98 / G3) TaxID=412133 RepID=A2FXU5_TRIV3|nr:uncharacterized protein TVAGG3_0692020 [Trichomonas vaginalis G3]EAX90280.1 Leucine Rich Repeat family protein [Trichomonas vaginalis G3]KAI5508643.1 interleukin-8 biosynthetic process [Trichomonas vaginalis G3]|eukprot:XP_001303210.1 hypothetical protein [Trichomonas vaginalis G3]